MDTEYAWLQDGMPVYDREDNLLESYDLELGRLVPVVDVIDEETGETGVAYGIYIAYTTEELAAIDAAKSQQGWQESMEEIICQFYEALEG